MKKTIFLFSLLAFTQWGFAQKEAAIWYFGRNAGVDFNSGMPVALTDGQLYTGEGCATISDSDGNLLFYTDGRTVWNRNHEIMENGAGLLGDDDSTHSALIVPRPNSTTLFYIFTVDAQAGPDGMNYSEVDMTLDGGLGAITQLKNNVLLAQSTEHLTAVHHANGQDIWLIGHPWNSDRFNSFLITPSGINTNPVESPTPLLMAYPPNSTNSNYAVGQIKASPDATKIGIVSSPLGVYVLDFDNQTGFLTNLIQVNSRSRSYGIEFSPSGKLLYSTVNVSHSVLQTLYQYDLEQSDITASEVLIAEEPYIGHAVQLAMNGKIYGIVSSYSHLYSIEDPNALGLACNFIFNSVDLSGREGRAGLPPFIQSYFSQSLEIEYLCLGNVTEFDVNSSQPLVSVIWDFGDGTTSTDVNPSHTYDNPGVYMISAHIITASGAHTKTKEIVISPQPIAHKPDDVKECYTGADYSLNLTLKDSEVLGTQPATYFSITYHSSQSDADAGINSLESPYTFLQHSATVFARITATENNDCYDTTFFDILINETPVFYQATDWTVCDTDTDGQYEFDLSIKDAEILGGQNATIFDISYFETQEDADIGMNAIGPNYTNTASAQEIFFRIANSASPECYKTGSFSLEVITGVTAYPPAEYEVCDTDNDGIQTIDLLSKNAEIIGSQNPGSISVSYHLSQQDAHAGMYAVSNTYTNTNPYSETLYVRVENTSNPDCYDTTILNLAVYDSPIIQEVSNWQVCDSDNDGVASFMLTEKDEEILGDQPAADFSVSYHLTGAEAQTGQNAIAGTFENTTNPQQLFYRVENIAHPYCYLNGSFSVEVFDAPVAYTASTLIACDLNETGVQSFDLNTRDAEILGGQDPGTYSVNYFSNEQDALTQQNALPKQSYSNTQPQETIYARVSHNSNSACYAISSFEIIVNPLPQPGLEETYVICPDSPELTIDGGNFESWSWENNEGTEIWNGQYFSISELGNYTLTVSQTQNGRSCEKTVTFEVVSSGAPDSFTYNLHGFSDQIELVIEATGVGEFEYSLDGQNYQDQNDFIVFPGTYTVFVRDKYECRTIQQDLVAIGYLRFFTPNGDGTNEHWNIIGGELYTDATLFIYDRYGKLLKQLALNSPGWDGTYQGKPLPSADYWFRYEYDNGKAVTGHFALKR